MPTDRNNYPGIPGDFPVGPTLSALSGAYPKMSLIEEDGKFYSPGTTPSEVRAVFEICKDLVPQMVAYCERKLPEFDGKQQATIRAAFQGLLSKHWCSPEQCKWIMKKVVHELNWPFSSETLTN